MVGRWNYIGLTFVSARCAGNRWACPRIPKLETKVFCCGRDCSFSRACLSNRFDRAHAVMGAHGPTLALDHDRSAFDSLGIPRNPNIARIAQGCAKTSAWSISCKSVCASLSCTVVEPIHWLDCIRTCELGLALSNFLWRRTGIKSDSPN